MNLESRVEKLESLNVAPGACSICDGPPVANEPKYDQSVWMVGETYPTEFDCVECNRLRSVTVEVLERRPQ